jgi:phosphotransferase system enzyme I (PtsI)
MYLQPTADASGRADEDTSAREPEARPNPEAEFRRLSEAIEETADEIGRLKERALAVVGQAEAAVFDAHLLILRDPELERRVRERLAQGERAEEAVRASCDEFARELEALADEYLSQRAADVRDVGQHLLRVLGGAAGAVEDLSLESVPPGSVLVAVDLAPSDTVRLDPEAVAAIATARGGPTSHTAIFARAMGIPAVVGTGPELLASAQTGETVLVDGDEGLVIVRPKEEEVASARAPARGAPAPQRAPVAGAPDRSPAGPATETRTRDGWRVKVEANIGHAREAEAAIAAGAEGVGLMRSEFLFLGRTSPPSEEEQYEAYRAVAESFGDRPVIIRTLDVGGDKALPYLEFGSEANPFLGWRGLRVCLDREDLFRTHLRAILRASAHGNVSLMFPMVAGVEEVRAAIALVDKVKADLRTSGTGSGTDVRIGVMVETPAAALLADHLVREVDFLSLGTNDLTQYTLAVDRTNERVTRLYRESSPALIKLIAATVAAARRAGRRVGVCGEMAGDLSFVPLLVGLGVDELSVSVPRIQAVKRRIAGLDRDACAALAERCLECATPDEVDELLAAV